MGGTTALVVGSSEQVRCAFSVLFHCINIFLRISFSKSHISSTSSPPTIVQTGKSDPLNAFIKTPTVPDNVGAAAANNTAGTQFGRGRQPGHRYLAILRGSNGRVLVIFLRNPFRHI